jgi:hypothetical protein
MLTGSTRTASHGGRGGGQTAMSTVVREEPKLVAGVERRRFGDESIVARSDGRRAFHTSLPGAIGAVIFFAPLTLGFAAQDLHLAATKGAIPTRMGGE